MVGLTPTSLEVQCGRRAGQTHVDERLTSTPKFERPVALDRRPAAQISASKLGMLKSEVPKISRSLQLRKPLFSNCVVVHFSYFLKIYCALLCMNSLDNTSIFHLRYFSLNMTENNSIFRMSVKF